MPGSASRSASGRTRGGSAPPSVSRSNTRGSGPMLAVIVSRTLLAEASRESVPGGSQARDRIKVSLPSPTRSRQRGQRLRGEPGGSSSPQFGQVGRSDIGGASSDRVTRRSLASPYRDSTGEADTPHRFF